MNYIYFKLLFAMILFVISCIVAYCCFHVYMYYTEKEQKENDKGVYKI
jgi:hypothetical protein